MVKHIGAEHTSVPSMVRVVTPIALKFCIEWFYGRIRSYMERIHRIDIYGLESEGH